MGRSSRTRRRRSERGASLLEAAIASVVVMSVIFGVIEFGLAFKDYLSMSAAVRDAARVASTYGTTTATDYTILQSIKTRMPAVSTTQIQAVVVFKAANASSTITSVNSTCMTASVANVCNFYTSTDIARPSSDFTGASGAPDGSWPPSARKDKLSGPPDYVGVWVKISHTGLTGFLSLSKNYTDQVIMRIEPATLS